LEVRVIGNTNEKAATPAAAAWAFAESLTSRG